MKASCGKVGRERAQLSLLGCGHAYGHMHVIDHICTRIQSVNMGMARAVEDGCESCTAFWIPNAAVRTTKGAAAAMGANTAIITLHHIL